MTSSHQGYKDFLISNQGLAKILSASKEAKYPGQNVLWTDDYRVELPIRLGSSSTERIEPTTLVDEWKLVLSKFSHQGALSVKRNNKWVSPPLCR